MASLCFRRDTFFGGGVQKRGMAALGFFVAGWFWHFFIFIFILIPDLSVCVVPKVSSNMQLHRDSGLHYHFVSSLSRLQRHVSAAVNFGLTSGLQFFSISRFTLATMCQLQSGWQLCHVKCEPTACIFPSLLRFFAQMRLQLGKLSVKVCLSATPH